MLYSQKTDVGSKGSRLALTKSRMSEQQMTFKKLKSTNEDKELSDIIIDYTAAYNAYQASMQAASKDQADFAGLHLKRR